MFGGRPVGIPTPGFKCAQQWAPGAALEWMFINDNVMGGQSTSKLDADPSSGAIILSGVMDDLRGGFVQLRTAQSCRVVIPDGATSVKVTAQGDGQLYKLYLSGSGRGGPMWGHDFVTSESTQEHVLPLSGFNPSVMGQAVNGPSLDPTQVRVLPPLIAHRLKSKPRLQISMQL